jgi:hypothetical protein
VSARTRKHASLSVALVALERDLPDSIERTGTFPDGRRYIELDHLYSEVKPLLAKHSLLWATLPSGTVEQPTLTYSLRLAHNDDADYLSGTMPLFVGRNPTPQSYGAALTMGRRYALLAVLNLVGEQDTDGAEASKGDGRSDLVNAILDGKLSASDAIGLLQAAGITPPASRGRLETSPHLLAAVVRTASDSQADALRKLLAAREDGA